MSIAHSSSSADRTWTTLLGLVLNGNALRPARGRALCPDPCDGPARGRAAWPTWCGSFYDERYVRRHRPHWSPPATGRTAVPGAVQAAAGRCRVDTCGPRPVVAMVDGSTTTLGRALARRTARLRAPGGLAGRTRQRGLRRCRTPLRVRPRNGRRSPPPRRAAGADKCQARRRGAAQLIRPTVTACWRSRRTRCIAGPRRSRGRTSSWTPAAAPGARGRSSLTRSAVVAYVSTMADSSGRRNGDDC